MRKAEFGSREFKEKDSHASEHDSGMKRSISNGFLPVVIKRAGFGNQEFKDYLCHTAKDLTEIRPHHQLDHHHHGTRDKEIFGFEDVSVNAREHDNLFGMSDMKYQENIEKASTLFGFEDIEFERGEKGRDKFGSDDHDRLIFRRRMEILGHLEADVEEIERTTRVFRDENAEDDHAHEVNQEAEDDHAHEKAAYHEHSIEVGVKLMNSDGGVFSKKCVVKRVQGTA